MKRYVFLISALVCASFVVSAAERRVPAAKKRYSGSGYRYGTAGCGLGSIVFKDKKGMIQIVAATLNATGYQTFAITSGTSNCVDDNSETASSAFIEANRVALETDISRGAGENLNTFAKLEGCVDGGRLGQHLQQNYSEIFSNKESSSIELRNAIRNVIRKDESLAKTCERVG